MSVYEIFRKNLGLMIAPASENSTNQEVSVHQKRHIPYAQLVREGLLFVKKLEWTMNWSKMRSWRERRSRMKEGREKEGIAISSTEAIHG